MVPEIKGAGARFAKAKGEKCARCWRVLEEVNPVTHLCRRCTDAVGPQQGGA
jgi:isoleucyl-tRNA synthetase